MNNRTVILSLCLLLSLTANVYFAWHYFLKDDHTNEPAQYPTANIYVEDTVNSGALAKSAANTKQTQVRESADLSQESQQTAFSRLQQYAAEQRYEELQYELKTYLRHYPNDVDALLLEGQAYAHTLPLSQAIVHYYGLLSLPLSKSQLEDVQHFIASNTSTVIQQFTADKAWDLLAKFLEPLVQVDPLNRQYILSLGRAYGMQEQSSLMENVLAALSPDDPRAQRLRAAVNAKISAQSKLTFAEASATNNNESLSFETADLEILKTDGKFITQVSISNTKLNLLLDTGASTTAISNTKFSKLPADEHIFMGKFNVNTAGGTIQAPIYKVSSLFLGDIELRNTNVIILPANNLHPLDGLLGMNALSQFNIKFDAQNENVKLFKK